MAGYFLLRRLLVKIRPHQPYDERPARSSFCTWQLSRMMTSSTPRLSGVACRLLTHYLGNAPWHSPELGYLPGHPTIVTLLIFEAVVLGIGAILVGILLGELISRLAFNAVPAYLATGFPIGNQRVVSWMAYAFAITGGICSAAPSARCSESTANSWLAVGPLT